VVGLLQGCVRIAAAPQGEVVRHRVKNHEGYHEQHDDLEFPVAVRPFPVRAMVMAFNILVKRIHDSLFSEG
jgi:hypothetical protein